jgi:hypothetical protein
VVASSDGTSSVLAYRGVLATQQGGGGVTRIVGGTNITVDPPGGVGVVTVTATGGAGGGVTSIASANANLTVSPGGGTGAVTLTVPTQGVPNPILDASLGINSTGTGATTIGSTTAGTIALVSPNVRINATGPGITQIGNTTGGPANVNGSSMLIQTPGVVLSMNSSVSSFYAPTSISINSIGSGNTNIGNATGTTTFTGTVNGIPLPNPILNATLGLNTTGSGTTTIGSTAAGTVSLVSPTVNINTSGTGNVNIGNSSGTTTFAGTILGLPAATPQYASYQYSVSGTAVPTGGAFLPVPFDTTLVSSGSFSIDGSLFRSGQSGTMRITASFSIANSSGVPGKFYAFLADVASRSYDATTRSYLVEAGGASKPATLTYTVTFPSYVAGTQLQLCLQGVTSSLVIQNSPYPSIDLFATML